MAGDDGTDRIERKMPSLQTLLCWPPQSLRRSFRIPKNTSTMSDVKVPSLMYALIDIVRMKYLSTHVDTQQEVIGSMTNIALVSALILTMLSVSPGDAVGSALSDHMTHEVRERHRRYFTHGPNESATLGSIFIPHPCMRHPPAPTRRTQDCEHVYTIISSLAIFCLLWATLVSAWVIAIMGFMNEDSGRAFIKNIGPLVLKMPMALLLSGMVFFFWMQVTNKARFSLGSLATRAA